MTSLHRWRPSVVGLGLPALLALAVLACGHGSDAQADMLAPVRPVASIPAGKGVHTLYFIRHGAYATDDPADPDVGKHLVPLGRRQAALVAERLRLLPRAPETLHASTMSRARETAEIIGKTLGLEPVLATDLRECQPPTRPGQAPADEVACRVQIEHAIDRLLTPSPERDRVDVVVAHGNVIRYITCRALGIDPLAWPGLGVTHTGMTTILVRPDGRKGVLSYNDIGHLAPELQTLMETEPLQFSHETRAVSSGATGTATPAATPALP